MKPRALAVSLLKLALCVQGVLPAITLYQRLARIDRHFIVDYDYRVLALGIAETGVWAFIFLFAALACTPLARITGFRWPNELRRTLGLLAFFWCCLHFVVYLVIGQKLNWTYALEDAWLRKSRIPGWLSLLLLVPLAITSTDGMIRRLGGKRWKNLHRLVYASAAFAVLHLAWVDYDYRGGYARTKRALIPLLILLGLRLVPLTALRKKLESSRSTRSSLDP
ncbi:MAG TPA: ferric reductase-like transmembrane domain-containing protein [Polyangiaceae bacterium]|nr:ferric reductase-like transmembrane domain-containing protein [Polyangiaceae bacterium]